MIKGAGVTGDGSPLLLLGLSGENVARLVAGEPILIRAGELGPLGLPRVAVAIVYGKTEDAIVADLEATFKAVARKA